MRSRRIDLSVFEFGDDLAVAADGAEHAPAEWLHVHGPAVSLVAGCGAAAGLQVGALDPVQRPDVDPAGPGGQRREVVVEQVEQVRALRARIVVTNVLAAVEAVRQGLGWLTGARPVRMVVHDARSPFRWR